MPGNFFNPTTMWTPQAGYDPGWLQTGMPSARGGQPAASPFMISNPKYNPNDPNSPQTIQDPTATAQPGLFTNSAGTRGLYNPFGLTQNMPNFGFFGANPYAGNPAIPAGGMPGKTGFLVNNQWIPFNQAYPAGNAGGGGGAPSDFIPPPPPYDLTKGSMVNGQYVPFSGFIPAPPQNLFGPPPGVGTGANPLAFHLGGPGAYQADVLHSKNPLALQMNPPPGATDASSATGGGGTGGFPFGGGSFDTTVPGQAPIQYLGGKGGYLVNGQWIPFSQAGITPTPPPYSQGFPPSTQPLPPGGSPGTNTAAQTNPYSWLQGVTSSHLDANGNLVYDPTNPSQFASPQTAQAVAAMWGMAPWQLQLGGPGMGFSQNMQMFGPGVNAGLAAGELARYGSGPGSYGQYLVNRDVTGNYGPSPWDTKINPGAATYSSPTTTGGGSLTPTTPNIFTGPTVGGTPGTAGGIPVGDIGGTNPGGIIPSGNIGVGGGINPGVNLQSQDPITALLLGQGGGGAGGGSTGTSPSPSGTLTPDQWLATSGGSPTDATPAWAAMVAAMNRNVQRGAADLQAKFAASGDRFSSDFGTAATDYYNQANLNQNSLLGQMQLQSLESAANRNQAGISQLSSQDFQSLMQASGGNIQGALQAMQLNSAAGQADLNRQLQAAAQFMQLGYGGSTTMAQLGAGGAQGMFGAETSAAQQEIQRQLLLQQLGLGAMTSAGQLGLSNLGLGNTIAQGQFGALNQQATAAYQEWLRQQPQYNPLLSMMYSGATAFPPMYQPQWAPSNLQSILGAAGSILGGGGLAALIRLIQGQRQPSTGPNGQPNPFPGGGGATYPGGGGGGGTGGGGGGGWPGSGGMATYPPFILGWPTLGDTSPGANGPLGTSNTNIIWNWPGTGPGSGFPDWATGDPAVWSPDMPWWWNL